MAFNKTLLKRDINKDINTVEQMKMLVEATKAHQAKKGRDFHCEVFAASSYVQVSDLYTYLRYIRDQGPKETNPRINILNRSGSYHWNAIQAQWIGQKLHIFLVDAAGAPDIKYSLKAIKKACPDAVSYMSKPVTQSDSESCAFFSLHNIISMFKISNLFELLNGISENKEPGQFPCEINIEEFPASFGSLIQNIQSLTRYYKLAEKKSYFRNTENKTVDAYINDHKQFNRVAGKNYNHAIEHTKKKYRDMAEQWIESLSEVAWKKSMSSIIDYIDEQSALSNRVLLVELALFQELENLDLDAFYNWQLPSTLCDLLWDRLTKLNNSLKCVSQKPNPYLNVNYGDISSDVINQFCQSYEAEMYKTHILDMIAHENFCLGKWIGTLIPVGGAEILLPSGIKKKVPHTIKDIWTILQSEEQYDTNQCDSYKIEKIHKLLAYLPGSWKRPLSVQVFYQQLQGELEKMVHQNYQIDNPKDQCDPILKASF